MGWNSITVNKNSRILKNIGSEPYVYFVHSYYVNAEDEALFPHIPSTVKSLI